jgi:hypothetical protein
MKSMDHLRVGQALPVVIFRMAANLNRRGRAVGMIPKTPGGH